MSNLAETMDKFPTVHGENCKVCGNAWWFERECDFLCTTCGSQRKKTSLQDSIDRAMPERGGELGNA